MEKAAPKNLVVFTDGVFDMLHANHVAFLEDARSLGKKLVVGVVSDAQAQSFKRTPVINELERLAVVRALRCVDHAFIIHDPLNAATMEMIIREYLVGAVVYAGDATPEFYVPAEQAGIMHRPQYRAGINTSDIIARILGGK
jgi:cytidyltransferase-like protein